MAQRDVREGGFCFYTPDEDYRVPISVGNQVFIYGWPFLGSCFDTLNEAVAWVAAQPLSFFWEMERGPGKHSDALFAKMECVIDPAVTVQRAVPHDEGWRRGDPLPRRIKVGLAGWIGQVVECRQLRPGEREAMKVERLENIRRSWKRVPGHRRPQSAFLSAMRGVSQIMNMRPTISLPLEITNTSWGETTWTLNG